MKSCGKAFPAPGKLELEAFKAGNEFAVVSRFMSRKVIAAEFSGTAQNQKLMRSIKKILALKEKLVSLSLAELAIPTFDLGGNSQVQPNFAKEYIPILLEVSSCYDQRHCCERSFGTS